MIALTIDNVDGFIAKLQRKGIDVRWNGWNIVFFRENKGALSSPHGRRLDNRWGFEKVISPNRQGKWLVDSSLITNN